MLERFKAALVASAPAANVSAASDCAAATAAGTAATAGFFLAPVSQPP